MGLKEENQVKMVGVLPSQGADPIPVRLSTESAGAGMIEKNQVRMVGVLPSQGADPIPVSGMLYPSPIALPHNAFIPQSDTIQYTLYTSVLVSRLLLTSQVFFAPVFLPDGVTVTKLTLFGYRDDAASVFSITLYRNDRADGNVIMGTVIADWTTGYSSKYDDSIASALIDNDDYQYVVYVTIDPNDSIWDVRFSGVKIEFTA